MLLGIVFLILSAAIQDEMAVLGTKNTTPKSITNPQLNLGLPSVYTKLCDWLIDW